LSIPLHPVRPRLLASLKGYDLARFGRDLGAGLTVGIVALPLAMAFAIASGVKPEAGLVTAIVAGFLISALGGSTVQIGGPAGAFIVIVYGIVERYGLANLLISTMMAGVLLFLMGLLRLGALIRYIPVSIVIGFTNGIAVLIALSQVKDLLGLQVAKMPAEFFSQIGTLASHLDSINPTALALGLACLAIVVWWPKSYTMPTAPTTAAARWRRLAAHLPGTIVALAAATAATVLLSLPVETIGSRFGGIPQTLPSFALPEFSWATAQQLVFPTVTIALLGSIESLLCARVADHMTEYPRHDPNQELMAQGVANVASPLFGGIPATGTIARTVTNVRAGATSPVSGIVHALSLLAVMWVAAPLAAHVPLAALAGILLFVAWNMGEWREFVHARRFNLPYRAILFGTFILTVVFDLTVAVQVGVLLACASFIWRMGQLFQVTEVLPATAIDTAANTNRNKDMHSDSDSDTNTGMETVTNADTHASRETAATPDRPRTQVFALQGSLFFGAVGHIEDLPGRVAEGTQHVRLDLDRLMSLDTSGLDALQQLHRALTRRGVTLSLDRVPAQPLSLMQRSGFAEILGRSRIRSVGDRPG
jgi:SulP family sulfate permease